MHSPHSLLAVPRPGQAVDQPLQTKDQRLPRAADSAADLKARHAAAAAAEAEAAEGYLDCWAAAAEAACRLEQAAHRSTIKLTDSVADLTRQGSQGARLPVVEEEQVWRGGPARFSCAPLPSVPLCPCQPRVKQDSCCERARWRRRRTLYQLAAKFTTA